MKQLPILLLLPLAVTLGCEGPSPAQRSERETPGGLSRAPPAPAGPGAAQERAAGRQPPAADSPVTANLPLTLDQAIRTALERNPALAVERRSEDVGQASFDAARAYPYNPELEVEVRPLARTVDGESEDVLVATHLVEEIEIAGQGRHRRRAAGAELDLARSGIRQAEARAIAETARRFFTVLFRRERFQLDDALARSNAEFLGVLERRFQAGLATRSEVGLARMRSREKREVAQLSQSRLRSDLLLLERELGLSGGGAEPAGELGAFPWLPPERLRARAGAEAGEALPENFEGRMGARPDVEAAEASTQAARARLDLASSSRVPNLALGPVYERDEAGTTFLGVITKVRLPVVNTGRALVRQRQAELDQSLEAGVQLRKQARHEIRSALLRYEEAGRLATQFKDDQAAMEVELRRIRDHYDAGQATVVELYLARDNLTQARANQLDALSDLAQAAVDLAASLALDPRALLSPAPPPEAAPH